MKFHDIKHMDKRDGNILEQNIWKRKAADEDTYWQEQELLSQEDHIVLQMESLILCILEKEGITHNLNELDYKNLDVLQWDITLKI